MNQPQNYEVQHSALGADNQTNMRKKGKAESSKRLVVHVDVRFNGTSLPNAAPRVRGPGVAEHAILVADWVALQRKVFGQDPRGSKQKLYPESHRIDPEATFVANPEEDERIQRCKDSAARRYESQMRGACASAGYTFEELELTGDDRHWPREIRRMHIASEVPWEAVFQEEYQRSPLPLRWARIVEEIGQEDDDDSRRQAMTLEAQKQQMTALAQELAVAIRGSSGGGSDELAAIKAELEEVKAELARRRGGRPPKDKPTP